MKQDVTTCVHVNAIRGHIFTKMVTGCSDTGGKLAAGVNYAGGNLPLVSMTKAVNLLRCKPHRWSGCIRLSIPEMDHLVKKSFCKLPQNMKYRNILSKHFPIYHQCHWYCNIFANFRNMFDMALIGIRGLEKMILVKRLTVKISCHCFLSGLAAVYTTERRFHTKITIPFLRSANDVQYIFLMNNLEIPALGYSMCFCHHIRLDIRLTHCFLP